MSYKILPSKELIYDVLNDENGWEQSLLDFYSAYIKAVSLIVIYQDIGDYKEYYIEELENEIKQRIVTKLPVLRNAVREKLDNDTLLKKSEYISL